MKIGLIDYRPQVNKTPFVFEDKTAMAGAHKYVIASVDAIGRRAEGNVLLASVLGSGRA